MKDNMFCFGQVEFEMGQVIGMVKSIKETWGGGTIWELVAQLM